MYSYDVQLMYITRGGWRNDHGWWKKLGDVKVIVEGIGMMSTSFQKGYRQDYGSKDACI